MGKMKVAVGMSGGVDSSVAAYLLKEQGYEVTGVTIRIWREEGAPCPAMDVTEDARRVADALGIPFYEVDLREAFKRSVVDSFIEEYLCGRTPNPCVVCNRYVKWDALIKWAGKMGIDCVATGHYARIVKRENGRYAASASKTARKDQTYALYRLTQEQLARTLMPIGDHTKEEVREIAEAIGIPVAKKPDSQEICFIPDHDYAAFIGRQAPGRVKEGGNFVTKDGTVLGRHKGIVHYTVGQRKGLGLAMGEPVFVTELRQAANEVVIGGPDDVLQKELLVEDVNYMGVGQVSDGDRFLTKIRYAHPGAMASAYREGGGRLRFVFDEAQRAVTPGRSAVFYDGGCVAGGGRIV